MLFAAWSLLVVLAMAAPTTEASPHFEMQESGVTVNLRGISAVSDAVVWASGENGTVVRTLDGGEHWEKVATFGTCTLHTLGQLFFLSLRR